MEFVYSDGGRSKYFQANRVGDCVCRAICNATGKDYKDVYDDLQKFVDYEREHSRRRKHKFGADKSVRNGVPKSLTKKYIEKVLGWKWHPFMTIGSGCKVHLTENELPNGVCILKVSRHITVIKDRVLYDTYDCSRDGTRCVYGYWSEQ